MLPFLRAPDVLARAAQVQPTVAGISSGCKLVSACRLEEFEARRYVGAGAFLGAIDDIPVLERLDSALLMFGYRPRYVAHWAGVTTRAITHHRYYSKEPPPYQMATKLAAVFGINTEEFWTRRALEQAPPLIPLRTRWRARNQSRKEQIA